MFHLCLFGGQSGQLADDKRVYVTILGGCSLRWPTFARQISELRQRGAPNAATPYFFVTLLGSTDVAAPTLAEEYVDLQNALRAGQLTLDDWDRSVAHVGSFRSSGSLTLFAGFDGDCLPSEDQELEDLALNRHLGYIPDAAAELLIRAIGQRGASRAAAVRQAVAAALAQPTPA